MTSPTIEEQLALSLALIEMRKAGASAPEAAGPEVSVSGEMAQRPGLLLMPSPAPEGNDIPRVLSPSSLNTWNDCEIFSNLNPSQVWAFWRYVWANPPSGKHEIQVRASDANGKLQTSLSKSEILALR